MAIISGRLLLNCRMSLKKECHPDSSGWQTGWLNYRLEAGTLAASGTALGMVVTPAPVPCGAPVAATWVCGTVAGGAPEGVNPRCLRTSVSSLAKVSP